MKYSNQRNLAQLARERISLYGSDKVEVKHILAGLLDGDVPKQTIENLADIPLEEMAKMTVEEICQFEGLGPTRALRLLLAIELGRRCLRERQASITEVRTPEDVVKLLDDMRFMEQEHFRIIVLNNKSKLIKISEISIGTINYTIVHPREIFKNAIRCNACAIILAHNHPSGDPTPSREDIAITKRLKEAGELIGIDVLDHIIISNPRWVSLNQQGLI